MKKTFLNRRNALLSPGSMSVGLVACLVVALLLFIRLLFPNFLTTIVSPFTYLGTILTSSTTSLRAGFTNNTLLASERDAVLIDVGVLRAENQRLTAKIADLEKLLGNEAASPEGVVAGVLARPPESPYDTLLVASGSEAGVSVGMTAFAPGGVPLGRVDSVYTYSARITLFSNYGLHTDGWVGTERIPATFVGSGAGTFTAEVPKAAAVSMGDAAYLPGPGALPMGTIERIDTSPAASSAVLRIRPLSNIFSLTWVLLRP